jgi:hypothetical protein
MDREVRRIVSTNRINVVLNHLSHSISHTIPWQASAGVL